MLEAVPFDQSFSAEIEFGDQNHAKGYMSSVVYWYADQVAEVPLSGLRAHLLKHPGDRFALHGLMAPFYLLEREGLFADAADRMDYFAERYRSQPWSDRLKVRALAYREEVEGFDAIRAELSSFVGNRDPVAAQAAKDRLWLAEDPSHALLGIHALGKYRVFQDEKLVTEGSGRADLRVLRQIVDNRPHAWQVELEPTQQGSFFALCLRTQNGDITSAGEWEIVDAVPQSDRKIPEVFEGRQVLPNMTIWAFEPTSVINMQSPASGIRLWAPWRAYPDVKSVTLRKEWSVADIQSESVERERSDDELKAHAIN